MIYLFSLFAQIDSGAANIIHEGVGTLLPPDSVSPTTLDNVIHTLGYAPPWVAAGVTVFAAVMVASRYILPLIAVSGPAAPFIHVAIVGCAIVAGVVTAVTEYRNPGKIASVLKIPTPSPPLITPVSIKVTFDQVSDDKAWKCRATLKSNGTKDNFTSDVQPEKIDDFRKALTEKSKKWFEQYKDKNPEFSVLVRKSPFPGEQILDTTKDVFAEAAKGASLPEGRLKTMTVSGQSPDWHNAP